MTRAGIIAVHLGAVPAGVALSVLLSAVMPSSRAVGAHLRDTWFVAAHFHTRSLLAACALVVTLVAYGSGAVDRAIVAMWGFVLVHAACVSILQRSRHAAPGPPAGVISVVSARPALGYLYVASAVAGLLAVLAGMLTSLVNALRTHGF